MKKTLFLTLLALLLMQNAAAQPPVKPDSTNGDTLSIDRLQFRITYDASYVSDTLATPYRYSTGVMRLDVGAGGVSQFYNYTWAQFHAIRQQVRARGGNGRDEQAAVKAAGLRVGGPLWTFYKNYPTEGHTLLLDAVGPDLFLCDEPIETPDWELVPDSTAEVMGCQCQLAVAWFKGRQWSAWYAEDIPLNEGPWKLYGLPGLVLRAYDAQRQYVFEVTGMQQLTDAEDVTFVKKQRESTTQQQLRKMQICYDPDAALQARLQQDGITVVRSSGTLKRPVNPIER